MAEFVRGRALAHGGSAQLSPEQLLSLAAALVPPLLSAVECSSRSEALSQLLVVVEGVVAWDSEGVPADGAPRSQPPSQLTRARLQRPPPAPALARS